MSHEIFKKISFIVAVTIFTFAFLPFFTPQRVHAETEEIKIGVVTDLTGIGAYWGGQAIHGAKLAEQELKGQKINVKVFIGDHTFSTSSAVSEVRKMLAIDDVDAFYVEFAPTSVAVSPILKNSKKLFVSGSAATSILDTNSYAFKGYLDYEKGCREIGLAWKKRGITKVGMVKLNAEFAELCLKGANSVFPNLFVMSYNFSENVSTHILAMKNKGIEAIFNTGLEADMVNMLKAMSRINYSVPLAVAEPDGLNEKIISTGIDIPEGTMSFGFPELSENFKSTIKAFDNGVSDTALEAAAFAYTHVIQMAHAVNICGKRNIDCQVKELAKSPPSSTMGFLKWNNRIASYDFTLKEWKAGKLQLVSTFD